MDESEVLELFAAEIPFAPNSHMFCYFAQKTRARRPTLFVVGLARALATIDAVAPGYAKEMIGRMKAIRGTGKDQYEALLQICGEIYVAEGAAAKVDRDEQGMPYFHHEPAVKGAKNPEFEFRTSGTWAAVEVKTPKLIDFSNLRSKATVQLTTRVPGEIFAGEEKLLPRDNPVKDFLISAEAKFTAYAPFRPDAFRILTIVWDDFCNEPIAALENPLAGLFTDRSFYRDNNDNPIVFAHVDGVVICRYQHQIVRATREDPLIDDVMLPFLYRHESFPFKAFVQNPYGRMVPPELVEALNAYNYKGLRGAEYSPSDIVFWQ